MMITCSIFIQKPLDIIPSKHVYFQPFIKFNHLQFHTNAETKCIYIAPVMLPIKTSTETRCFPTLILKRSPHLFY